MEREFDGQMLGSIELFCKAAELASFTAAANHVGVTRAAVSRSISRLERRVGAQLFVRTTRSVRLTDSGRLYFEHCRRALGMLSEAERELAGDQSVPTGVVRLSLPTSYGHHRVLPLLSKFVQSYPEVRLEIQLSNQNVDFAVDGIDLSIRARVPPDSGLVARKLEDAELVVVASPAYLKRRGVPRTLDDLESHDCIQFVRPVTGQDIAWLLRESGKAFEFETRGRIRFIGDSLGLVTAAVGGAGVTQTYRFMVEQDLASGKLKEVLLNFAGASRPFSILYPPNRHMPRRVRVLIDFLLLHLRTTNGRRNSPHSAQELPSVGAKAKRSGRGFRSR
jgi:DNA-binding transcriptional LysR family regulator